MSDENQSISNSSDALVKDEGATEPRENAHKDTPEELFKTYLEYNRVLRTWFVAFGIGGPALFLIHGNIAKQLFERGQLRLVALLFLSGASSQICGALLNKFANWIVYYGTINNTFCTTRWYKAGSWLACQFWIDVILDLVTVVTFGIAIWLMLTLFGGGG
jgi:hypothetical protein